MQFRECISAKSRQKFKVCQGSVLGLAGESPAWVKASRQPSTESHVHVGNEVYEAGRREVSGFNAEMREGIEPRNIDRVGGRQRLDVWKAAFPITARGEGTGSPTGSKAECMIPQGANMNLGEPGYSFWKESGSRRRQAMKGKESRTVSWQSDHFIVPWRQGNACGGKGVAVAP